MLLRNWFSLISLILVVSLFKLLYNFNFTNIFHWISLIGLVVTIALTILVFLEQPHKKSTKQLEKTYSEFLKQKDRQIEELQNKGSLLFKTSLKKAETDVQLAELKRKLEEQLENNER